MSIFLETKRVSIKEPALDYLEEAFTLDSDPEVMRFMGGARDIAATRQWMEKNIQHQEKHGFGFGFVYDKESGVFLGRAGILYLSYDETQPDIEVACRLHKIFWGKGYGVEIVRALLKWSFEHLSVDRVIATVHPKNDRSRGVVNKIGMDYVGKHKYLEYDEIMDRYEILKKNCNC
jgi:RimJ/RimL family protein N-acetyltransferase